MRDPIFLRYRPTKFHDGIVTTIKPNYAGLGSFPKYDWNEPRTGSQPQSHGSTGPTHSPQFNLLIPIVWSGRQIPEAQLQTYLSVQNKTYGKSMDFAPADVASLKG